MIKNINGNIFTDEEGKTRYLYNLHPKDLEQLTISEILSEKNNIKNSLKNLKPEEIFKIYNLDQNCYLDTSSINTKINLEKIDFLIGGRNHHPHLIRR